MGSTTSGGREARPSARADYKEAATDRSIVDERIGLDHKGEGRASSVRLYKVI